MERPIPSQSGGVNRRALFTTVAAAALAATAAHAGDQSPPVAIGYLRWTERRQTISLLDKPPPDDGLAGARLAINDNNTTGRFINQQFTLVDVPLRSDDDPVDVVGKLATQGVALALTDVPAAVLLTIAAPAAFKSMTLFNVAAVDDALRQESCRSNLIHVAPARAMLSDALVQYLVWKKWTRLVLAYGSHSEDMLLADAYRRSAKRFGARILKEIEF